jgi:predicted nucleic acid-binding protein
VALHYLDTSALAKKYLPETGSDWVRSLVQSEPVAVSILAGVELASALARRARQGDLSGNDRDLILQSFRRDLSRYLVVNILEEVIEEAIGLLLTSPETIALRSLDSLHVATARIVFNRARRSGIEIGDLVTSDKTLTAAASWVGITTKNPEDYR